MLEALAYEPPCLLPCHRHSTLAMRHREALCGMSWLLDSLKCHGLKRTIIHLRETRPKYSFAVEPFSLLYWLSYVPSCFIKRGVLCISDIASDLRLYDTCNRKTHGQT